MCARVLLIACNYKHLMRCALDAQLIFILLVLDLDARYSANKLIFLFSLSLSSLSFAFNSHDDHDDDNHDNHVNLGKRSVATMKQKISISNKHSIVDCIILIETIILILVATIKLMFQKVNNLKPKKNRSFHTVTPLL